MNIEGLTIYNQGGGFKSLGWDINSSILKGSTSGSLVVPAGLLYLNNNFKAKQIKSIEKGIVNGEIFDKLYGFIDSKTKKNKTKKRRRKRKNKTKRY